MSGKRPGIAELDSASGAKRTRVENPGPTIIDLTSSPSPPPALTSSTASKLPGAKPTSSRPAASNPKFDEELHEALTNLDPDEFEGILRRFAPQFPALRNHIVRKYKDEEDVMYGRVQEFNWQSKEVWTLLNKKYKHLSSSSQCHLAPKVKNAIDEIICSLEEEAEFSSYGTRKNAIMTLRKIGKSIALNAFTNTFLALARRFKGSEKESMLQEEENGWFFEDKLVGLIHDSRKSGIFPYLRESLYCLRGLPIPDSEEETDEEFLAQSSSRRD
ncbi:hypothetical protein HDK77DRAFT_492187 [Phyllosticta capitalensis]